MGGVWQPQGSSPHPCRRHGAPRAPDACRPRPLASGSSAASKTRKAPNHAHRRLQLQGNHPRHHSNWPQRLEARDPGNHHEALPVSALIRQPETMARARSRVTVLLCVQSSKAEVREPSAAYPQKVGPIQTATPGPHELDTITADDVLSLEPDFVAMHPYKVGVIGLRSSDETDAEVRAFAPSLAVGEDPVTGSLNASLAQWLIGTGTLPARYVAAQGTKLGRAGRVHIERVDGTIWVGGDTVTTISGTVNL